VTPSLLAELSASDLALVVVTGCAIVSIVGLLWALQRTLATVREVARTLDELNAEALPLIEALGASLAEANEELARVDRLVGSAESISATVDATSKLAYRALSAPMIKTVAVTSGASKAARRLRKER
jgi:predicted acylesterase/phospholipase RssA